jgi:GxxExxY protein
MDYEINDLTSKILKCAFKVHTELGPGLLESAYEDCLCHELKQNGILVEKQKSLPLMYSTIKVETGFRIDLLVEKSVVVEIKAVTELNDIHLAQVLTYLKLSNCKIGLLINFNVTSLKFGIRRIIR